MDAALLKKISDLAQLDTDAVGVYDEALKYVDDADVKEKFVEFHDEHAHHAGVLSAAVGRLGGETPKLNVDMMGHLAEFVTQVRSMRGTKGALHALRTAEKFHNSHYEAAAGWDIEDVELKNAIGQFYAEEQRHLAYVEEQLGVHAAAQ